MLRWFLWISLLPLLISSPSQSVCATQDTCIALTTPQERYLPHPAAWTIPATLIGAGVVCLRQLGLVGVNETTRDWFKGPEGSFKYVDDIAQFVPTAAVCGMHLWGLQGRSSQRVFWEAGVVSFASMAMVVNTVKWIEISRRPDRSAWNSFPSGHTATAFVGAELLRVEYGVRYPWVAVGGYTMAIGTGLLRIHHDRHWLGDVLAGAGIGIASVWLGYYVQPYVDRALCWLIPPMRREALTLSFSSTSGLGLGLRYRF